MAIDEEFIIEQLSKADLIGDERGLISFFGTYLTQTYADFSNKMFFRFQKALAPRLQKAAGALLANAVQECGYFTFRGFVDSPDWEALMGPMIETDEDMLYALVALCNVFGVGKLKVKELIPGERFVYVTHNSFEADGYLELYGKSSKPQCYTLTGLAAGLMDLVYGREFPNGLNTFESVETKCRAKGDKVCEFVVKRATF
ncbi:MAG TPA: hypothetical protein ENN38_07525 [Actinobacteria bacterium]|nr:hypothetical protein [Actinomycetota bacterium]